MHHQVELQRIEPVRAGKFKVFEPGPLGEPVPLGELGALSELCEQD